MLKTKINKFDQFVILIKSYKKSLERDYEYALQLKVVQQSPNDIKSKWEAVYHVLELASATTENNIDFSDD